MQALVEYEAGVHVNGCGLHESIAVTDPRFTLDDSVCPVCAQVERFMRARYADELKAETDMKDDTPRASDGRTTSVRLLGPGIGA